MTRIPMDAPDGTSYQDLVMAGMSREQIRIYRENAARQATESTRHASSHNQYMDDIQKAIHTGERLTNDALKRLIKNARSQSGIDAGELLDFTLGNTRVNRRLSQQAGLKNSLTFAMLSLYMANIKQARNSFVGGISPRQVINQSRAKDIERANKQIFLASTYKRQGNVVYFITNAGVGSKSKNHYVTVQLLDYPSLMVGRSTMPTYQEIKQLLEHGKIKFDCDCGRHQYWYRYIATIGKFNYGAHENRYPSTRNPKMTGVGCKHVLRVMHTLISSYGVEKIKGYIRSDLASGSGKALSQRQTASQIRQEARAQANPRAAEHWRKQIRIKLEKQLKLAFKSLTPLPSQQQYQIMQQMQRVGIKFSKEQKAMFEAYQSSLAPYRNGNRK